MSLKMGSFDLSQTILVVSRGPWPLLNHTDPRDMIIHYGVDPSRDRMRVLSSPLRTIVWRTVH